MVITATYMDGSQKTITNYTYSPTIFSAIGTQTVLISYTENEVTEITFVKVEVSEAALVIPSQADILFYTGAEITPAWDHYDNSQIVIGGRTSAINAGQYTAIFTPAYGYKWSDGTKTQKSVAWEIKRAIISAVPMQNAELSYDGTEKEPAWDGYDSEKMVIGGVTAATEAGIYTATFTPEENYQWFDGTITAKDAVWRIIGAIVIVSIPSVDNILVYSGNAQSPVWKNFDAENSAISGQTSATDAGIYTVTFTLLTGVWSDGTTEPKNITWSISRAVVDVPTQSGTLIYTGDTQKANWNGYSAAQLTISGTTSAINAGSYIAAFKPTANYQWADGSTVEKSIRPLAKLS